uniref:Uncharacterized protein n=1 Tax=Sphaerodactylus townsendi TaxID=933632 RepID=A0ACB8F350_9SAUR
MLFWGSLLGCGGNPVPGSERKAGGRGRGEATAAGSGMWGTPGGSGGGPARAWGVTQSPAGEESRQPKERRGCHSQRRHVGNPWGGSCLASWQILLQGGLSGHVGVTWSPPRGGKRAAEGEEKPPRPAAACGGPLGAAAAAAALPAGGCCSGEACPDAGGDLVPGPERKGGGRGQSEAAAASGSMWETPGAAAALPAGGYCSELRVVEVALAVDQQGRLRLGKMGGTGTAGEAEVKLSSRCGSLTHNVISASHRLKWAGPGDE